MDPKKVKELEKVSVKSLAELETALKPFQQPSAIYKLLVEGMDLVKRQSEFANRAADTNMDAFGGYEPAMPSKGGHYSWVDTLIDRRLNGKRDGFLITWNLPEGKFTFDAWTQKLEKLDG